MIAAKFIQLTTNADGASFTPFESHSASSVSVINKTGTDLTFLRTPDIDEGEFVLPDGMAWQFRGITNADQISVKRTDESTTPVTLTSVEIER